MGAGIGAGIGAGLFFGVFHTRPNPDDIAKNAARALWCRIIFRISGATSHLRMPVPRC
jgi:hypothetical protein